MKRIILTAAFLLTLLLTSVSSIQAQTATSGSNFTIYNQGNVLGDSDIASIRTAAANFPAPLVVYITNQYKGAKVDFSRIIAKYVTDNNVVIGISTLQDSSGNYHYRLLGAGPHSGVGANVLDGAQTQMDTYLKASGGPQYTNAIVSAVGYIQGSLEGSGSSSGSGSTSNTPSSSSSSFWDIILGLLVIAFFIWLIFLFIRWLWRLSHPLTAAPRQGGLTTRGGGYYDSGPVFYPIWLGGGSYGGGGSGSSNAPAPSPSTGGGSFAGAFGGGGTAASNTGGGNFESSFAGGGKSGSSGSSNSSSTGSGVFESAINTEAASAATNAAVGEVAGAAFKILGGILGAVFSAGSTGSGPDF
jgi:hypothetical protein